MTLPSAKRMALGVLLLLVLTACAADANAAASTTHDAPGFFRGLWHGLILPITFVVSLFSDHVGIYEVKNDGHLYDLGFLLGAGGLSLPGFWARKKRR